MKRILYIAPHSFPIKSSESICNSKVAYVLASMGYQIDVLLVQILLHIPRTQR